MHDNETGIRNDDWCYFLILEMNLPGRYLILTDDDHAV